ncbi:MAG: ABC transporter permease [Bdellovibrionales bacterium]|nr:ABC transporter permease [Bdellovibrionales bacterium]
MKRKAGLQRWIAIFPGLWIILFLLVPLSLVVVYSFLKKGAYGGIVWTPTLDNYIRVLDPLYWSIVLKSLQFALLTTLSTLVLGFPVAYVIAKVPKSVRTVLMILVMIPFVTNFVVRAYALKGVLSAEGPLNSVLLSFGWIAEPISFLNSSGSIYAGMIMNYLPFMILPLYVAAEKMDWSLIEASRDLGAGPVQSFFHVLLPQLSPGILTGSLLVFVPALGEFVIPDVFGGAKTFFIGNLVIDQFLKSRDWPFGSALSMILFMVTGIGIWLRTIAARKMKVSVD